MRNLGRLAALLVSLFALTGATTAAPPEPHAKRVAVLLFDGVEIIDYSGPYEVFGAAGYEVFTVGRTKSPVTTAMGLTVTPRYDFADAPAADILVVPGGDVSRVRKDAETLGWIRKETAQDQHTLSVCNGALTMADAGLLDGLSATTTNYWIPRMRAQYPKIRVVDDQRWVDNGKIVTAAGLSSGIDGALHLVEVMEGRGEAQKVALNIEYDWRPQGDFVRAALADALIPDVDLAPLGSDWRMRETSGDRNQWAMRLEGASPRSAGDILDHVSRSFVDRGHWTLISADRGAAKAVARWRFAGKDGRPWKGTLTVAPLAGEPQRYVMDLAITRVS